MAILEEKLKCQLTVRLFWEEKAFGPGIAALLRNIERTGSLQKAAEAMGMAYSKAWKMIKELEELWGFKLTYRDIGGQNGGGSSLTPEGRALLEHYESFVGELNEKAKTMFGSYFSENFLNELRSGATKEGY